MAEKNSENIPKNGLKNAAIITSIQEDAKLFSNSLQELASFCTVNVEAIITKTLIDLFGRIVERTPIDTGRAKANWFMAPSPETEDFDEDNVGEYEYKFEDGTTVWIFNNLVYIIPLEEGWSDQAPAGMVTLSLREFDTFLSNAAAKLSSVVLD